MQGKPWLEMTRRNFYLDNETLSMIDDYARERDLSRNKALVELVRRGIFGSNYDGTRSTIPDAANAVRKKYSE